MNNLTTKAAMFGLDARIALAIFGALSVISGAALYSAIQDSRATALLVEHKELEKALESYLVDTATDPNHDKANASVYIACLIDQTGCNVTNWQGPYLPYTNSAGIVDHPIYENIYLRNNLDTVWSHPSDDAGAHYCAADSSKTCYYWTMVGGTTLALQKAIDLKVDNTLSDDSGDVRYNAGELYIKSIPMLNQN